MYSDISKNDLEYTVFILNQYQDATDHSVIISKTDPKGIITYVNDEFCRVSGYLREELLGENHNIIRHPENPKSIYKEMWDTIKSKKIWQGIIRNYTKSHETYYVKTTIKPIVDKDNKIIEYIALRDDITDIMDPKKQMHDLLDSMEESVFALVQIEDFDDMVSFYGQKLTKIIEESFADEFLSSIHEYSLFSKSFSLGNGQYAFINKYEDGVTDIEEIIEQLREFQESINDAHINIGEIDYDITIVFSLAYGKNAIDNAVHGLKKVLQTNKSFIVSNAFLDVEHERAKENFKTIKMIKQALDNKKIISYFQPIINNQTQEIEKYESLARLIDEENNIVLPYKFIAISKQGKYYSQITSAILDNSFDALSRCDKEISINLSVADIEKRKTRNKIYGLLETYKEQSKRVVLELLEDEDVKDFEVISTFITDVKKYGVKIAIDDFGAGYSNFKRLIEYQPDIVKIDGSLIKDIQSDPLSLSVVQAIVLFAKEQNIKIVAEYVENEDIFNILVDLGIHYSQGYYFGKPEPLD